MRDTQRAKSPRGLSSFVTLALLSLLAGTSACAPARGSNSLDLGSATPTPTAPTVVATMTASPSPMPTVATASCGAWSAANGSTGQPVATAYGAISNCELLGDSWLIATEGLSGKSGVIGVDTCHGDATCLNPQTDRGISAWRFYAAPYPGGVRILGVESPGVILIDNGGHQMRFTIAAGTYQA